MFSYMDKNDNILERIGDFYVGLELGKWTDYFIGKPSGFDDMSYDEKLKCTYPLIKKIDKLMADPWQVIKIWSRRKYIKKSKYNSYFDAFMEYELDYLIQKEQESQRSPKYRFLNWLCK